MKEHHREQSRINRCAPACARMVLSRLGKIVDEDSLCASASENKRGFLLEVAAEWVSGTYRSLDFDDPRNYEYLRVMLREDRWIITYVGGDVLGCYVESLPAHPISRFSPLSQDRGLHAIVLVGQENDDFRFLDPYYASTNQPLFLPGPVFWKAWSGFTVISPPLP